MRAQRELQGTPADFRHDQRADQAVFQAQRVPALKGNRREPRPHDAQPRRPVVEMPRTK